MKISRNPLKVYVEKNTREMFSVILPATPKLIPVEKKNRTPVKLAFEETYLVFRDYIK